MGCCGRALLGGVLLGLLTMGGRPAAGGERTAGRAAPAFRGIDDQGKSWASADHVGKNYLVVFFYVGDFTPGCTRQARCYRDARDLLALHGVEVVGVSCDAPRTHALFKKAHRLNFTLLADEEGAIARRFGVPVEGGGMVRAANESGRPVILRRGRSACRWTFVIGKDGKILSRNTAVDPAHDLDQVVALVQKLAKK